MTQGGPIGATNTLVIELYRQGFVYRELGSARRGRHGRAVDRAPRHAGLFPLHAARRARKRAAMSAHAVWQHALAHARGAGAARRGRLPALLDAGHVADAVGGSVRGAAAACCRRSSDRLVYGDAFATIPVATWLTNSAIVAAGTTVLSIALAILPAYALSRFRFRGKGLLGLRPVRDPDAARGDAGRAALRDLRQARPAQHAGRADPRQHGLHGAGHHLDPQGRDRRRADRDRGGRAHRRLLAPRHRPGGRAPAGRADPGRRGRHRLLPRLERIRLRADADQRARSCAPRRSAWRASSASSARPCTP